MKSSTFNVKILNRPSLLIPCILISIGLRFILFFIVDLSNENYWEYGTIAQNIMAGKGYSFFYTDQNELLNHFNINSAAQPSAFMPPGYVYFLLPFFWIKDIILRNILIGIAQHLISFFSIYFLAKYISQKFERRIALMASCIILLLPEFIASSHFIGTTVIYQMLLSIIFLLLTQIEFESNYIYPLAVIIGFGAYFRAELIGFYCCIAFIWWCSGKRKVVIQSAIIILLILSPWVIRNYNTFGKFIPFTTSTGLNLYRGHNHEGEHTWPDVKDQKTYQKIIHESNIEINLDSMFRADAWYAVKENPGNEIKNIIIKIYKFWIIDWEDTRTHSIVYWLPWFVILLLSLLGIYLSWDWQKFRFEYVFFCYSTFIILVFFPLPRYQTMMKLMLIPFAAYGISHVYKTYVKQWIQKIIVHSESL